MPSDRLKCAVCRYSQNGDVGQGEGRGEDKSSTQHALRPLSSFARWDARRSSLLDPQIISVCRTCPPFSPQMSFPFMIASHFAGPDVASSRNSDRVDSEVRGEEPPCSWWTTHIEGR